MVEDGASGFLVDPLDTEQIVECLSRLLRDRELRHRMGARGREIAEARFHPARVAEKTMQVYREIIGRASLATADVR